MSRKYFFWFFEIDKFSCFLSQFRSPHLTLDIRSWSRGSPFVMRSRKAGLPYAIRVRKRGDVLSMCVSIMTRAQNFLRQKFQKFSWKSLFSTSHVTLIIMSRKQFFGSSKFMFSIPISKSPPHPRYTILESRFPLCNAISEGRPPLCSASSEAGALPSEVRIDARMTLTENFLSQNLKFFFLESTFLQCLCYSDLFLGRIFSENK